ncbi:glutathione S-transferase [Thozetella sp. PMI_491]|nr:glutathione S-transferase [Thozetella sp. PMI_491]
MPPPDANLHPVATGRAKDTVDNHATDEPLKLYAGWFCPFVQRVWLALEERQIPYQYIEGKLALNPYHKPASLLELNPRGLVPSLQIGPGKALYESTVILEYLEEAYPDHEPHLLARDPYERARSRIWVDFVTSRVIPAFHRFLQFQVQTWSGEGTGEDRLALLRAEYRGKLLEFARELVKRGNEGIGGPYWGGRDVGLVDLVLVPWIERHWVFDNFKGGVGIPEAGQGGDDEAAWARWREWADAILHRESVQRTTSDREPYIPIYKRYVDDEAQSELAKATREGRGVP